jgi:hypothetical protein
MKFIFPFLSIVIALSAQLADAAVVDVTVRRFFGVFYAMAALTVGGKN